MSYCCTALEREEALKHGCPRCGSLAGKLCRAARSNETQYYPHKRRVALAFRKAAPAASISAEHLEQMPLAAAYKWQAGESKGKLQI